MFNVLQQDRDHVEAIQYTHSKMIKKYMSEFNCDSIGSNHIKSIESNHDGEPFNETIKFDDESNGSDCSIDKNAHSAYKSIKFDGKSHWSVSWIVKKCMRHA